METLATWTPFILFFLGIVQVVGLGATGWVLIKLVDHERQLYRLVSDRESEKRTIANVHSDFEGRLRRLEKRTV